MDGVLNKRELFFNNLILLGFDKIAAEKAHGIIFHKDMFSRPNKKGYEVITHFLFLKLKEVTNKDYQLIWPLLCREHDRLFQKSCFAYLTNISQESSVRFPLVTSSVLSTFGGDRFYELYLAFSCHILETSINKNSNIYLIGRPVITSENFEDARDTLQIATNMSMNKYIETERISCEAIQIWMKCAKDMCARLKELKSSLVSNVAKLKEKVALNSILYLGKEESEDALNKIVDANLAAEKKVKQLWKNLEEFLKREKDAWLCISTVVEDNQKKYVLEGQNYNITVPDVISKEFKNELEKIGGESSEIEGKLSIERFLKLFAVILEYFVQVLGKVDLIHIRECCSSVEKLSIADNLNYMKSLNKKLITDIIPDIKKSTEEMKQVLFSNSMSDEIEELCKEFPLLSSLNLDLNHEVQVLLPDRDPLINLQATDVPDFLYHDSTVPHELTNLTASSEEHPNCELDSGRENIVAETSLVEEKLQEFDSALQGNEALNESNLYNFMTVKKVHFQDSGTSSSIESNSMMLVDINTDPVGHFKLRESWFNEESLNSMSLSDLSLSD